MDRIRVFLARLFRINVGEWQTIDPVLRESQYFAWRITPDGQMQYRPLTNDEYREFFATSAL